MSDITRWKVSGPTTRLQPDANGPWVALWDYYRVTDRLIAERDAAQAEVERVMADVVKLRIDLNSAQVEASQRRGEVERLTARQTEMETHITGLTTELHRTRADGIELRWVAGEVEQLTAQRDAAQAEVERLKEQVAALTVAVEQADEMKAHAEAAAAAEEAETDRVMAERDAAQAEVERLRANGQAILDSSRPTDEDIWREAFMRQLFDHDIEKLMGAADLALALYRKRWPR